MYTCINIWICIWICKGFVSLHRWHVQNGSVFVQGPKPKVCAGKKDCFSADWALWQGQTALISDSLTWRGRGNFIQDVPLISRFICECSSPWILWQWCWHLLANSAENYEMGWNWAPGPLPCGVWRDLPSNSRSALLLEYTWRFEGIGWVVLKISGDAN